MLLYNKLKYSVTQLQKLAKERESIWPPPLSFNLMGNYTQQKGSSDKDDKKDVAQYVKFEIPLNIAEPNGDKYDRKVKIFNNSKAFEWCKFRETTDELFQAFGCKAETTNDANRHHHLYIAVFSGRAKEIYIQNNNHFKAKNNELEEEDQANDAELQKMIINEMAKSFFDNWENAMRECPMLRGACGSGWTPILFHTLSFDC
jgi:hypothetical protein